MTIQLRIVGVLNNFIIRILLLYILHYLQYLNIVRIFISNLVNLWLICGKEYPPPYRLMQHLIFPEPELNLLHVFLYWMGFCPPPILLVPLKWKHLLFKSFKQKQPEMHSNNRRRKVNILFCLWQYFLKHLIRLHEVTNKLPKPPGIWVHSNPMKMIVKILVMKMGVLTPFSAGFYKEKYIRVGKMEEI